MSIERIVDNEADAHNLLEYYEEFLDKCLNRFKEIMGVDKDGNPRNEANWKNKLPDLSYLQGRSGNDNSQKHNYADENVDVYYYCKFGIAYAFEYAKMYELLLRILDGDFLGVNSFGCGGFVDAWALAYARARNESDRPNLAYRGFDITRWPLRVFQEATDLIEAKNQSVIERFNITARNVKYRVSLKTRKPEMLMGIQAFDDQALRQNVFMFPKLLNELDLTSEVWRQFMQLLESFVSNPWHRCYYICVSHSYWDVYGSDQKKGIRAVRDMVDVFARHGFHASDALKDVDVQEDHLKRDEAVKGADEPWNVLYKYEIQGIDENGDPIYWKIKELDNDFRHGASAHLLYGLSNNLFRKQVKKEIKDLPEDLCGRLHQLDQKEIVRELESGKLASKDKCDEIGRDCGCQQLQSVGKIVFQIIKLTKTDA